MSAPPLDTKKVRAAHHDDPDPGTHTRTDTNQLQTQINTASAQGGDVAVRRDGFDKYEYVRESVRDTDLTHAEHRTLMVIWDHADAKTLEAFPSQATLASSLGIKDRRRVADLTRQLVAKGYLEVKRKGHGDSTGNRNVSTLYGLTLPIRTTEGVGVNSTPTPQGVGVTTTPGVGVNSTPTVGVNTTPLTDQGSDQRTTTTSAKGKDGQEDKAGVPQDWIPKAEHKALADTRGLDLTSEIKSYRDHNRNKPQRDWDATFTRWLELARVPDKTPKASPKVGESQAWMNRSPKSKPAVGGHASWMDLSAARRAKG